VIAISSVGAKPDRPDRAGEDAVASASAKFMPVQMRGPPNRNVGVAVALPGRDGIDELHWRLVALLHPGRGGEKNGSVRRRAAPPDRRSLDGDAGL
jgi:hypothetical protein